MNNFFFSRTLPLSHTCIKDTDPNRSVIYLDQKDSDFHIGFFEEPYFSLTISWPRIERIYITPIMRNNRVRSIRKLLTSEQRRKD